MASEQEALALLLLQARHPDNPDRPLPMVRAGCAQLLADAIIDAGWVSPDWVEREVSRPWRELYRDTSAKCDALVATVEELRRRLGEQGREDA